MLNYSDFVKTAACRPKKKAACKKGVCKKDAAKKCEMLDKIKGRLSGSC